MGSGNRAKRHPSDSLDVARRAANNYAVHVNSPDATSPPLTRPSLFKLQGAKLSSSMPTVFFSKVA